MSVRYSDLQGDIVLFAKRRWQFPTLNAEMAAVSTALASDTTTHSVVIEKPPLASHAGPHQTALTNELLRFVNMAKGGNLPTPSIIAAIDGVAGVLFPPGNIDVPYVSGTGTVGQVLSCTQGNWAGTPSSYAYQWKRDGATNIGSNASTYTLVAGDSAHNIACVVSATNATGTTAAPLSNFVHCA